MSASTFREYVANLEQLGERRALTSRSFLKIDRLTYRELSARVHQVAHYLSGEGIGRGDRVMIVATNSPRWVELLLGSLLLGATAVPVDVVSTPEALRRYIAETEPSLIFTGADRSEELGHQGRRLDDLGQLIASSPSSAPDVELDAEWPALIVFTSGTTAAPKGVVLSQKNVLANIDGVLARVDVDPNWRFLSVLPLSHTYELTSTLAVLSMGSGVYYVAKVTPHSIAEALIDFQITTIVAIPQMLALMLENVERTAEEEGKARLLAVGLALAPHLPMALRRDLFNTVHRRLGGHLNLVITGGALIPLDIATTWEKMGIRMVQGYGLTETSPILTCNSLEDRRLDSPGRALDNVELRIAGDGEIQARGPSVFREYWHNPDATRDAFTEDGWFRTGDVGRLEDGYLKIEGRLKFAIVRSSGMKVFPEDIEMVAHGDSRLGELCVVGVTGDRDESVVAVVIADEPDDVVERGIAELNSKLASFQHVDSWRRWPDSDFPRTRLLKVDRRTVQDWANDEGPAETHHETTTAVESQDPLVLAIRTTLDDPLIAVNDDDRLDDLGLDSLLRLSLASVLEERLGVSVPDEKMTPAMTVNELRALVSESSPTGSQSPPPTWPYRRDVRVVGNALRDHVVARFVEHWVTLDVEGDDVLRTLSEPSLFIFNHSDDFDGPVIYQSLPREIRDHLAVATGADVMSDHKVLAFIVRLCFAGFAFARSEPYMPSLEYVGRLIDRGWHVLIAPEGRLSANGELQEFKSGIGLLAVSLGVPVVPMKTIGLSGTVPLHAKWPMRQSRVTVRIGEPVRFAPSIDYEEATATLHSLLAKL
ncbi:MAG: AMP-binding protein [Acidimicrobiales bacterium]